MKISAILTTLALLSGCTLYQDPYPRAYPPLGPVTIGGTIGGGTGTGRGGIGLDADLFLIDPGAGVDLPLLAYAITTNAGGLDWTLAWTGDAYYHDFTGEIVNGGRLGNVLFAGGRAGDEVAQVEPNRVHFAATTDGTVTQSIHLSADTQPLRFSLFIDGVPAISAVVWMSSRIVSTTDVMPFDLISADVAQSRKSRLAEPAKFDTTVSAKAGGRGSGGFIEPPSQR